MFCSVQSLFSKHQGCLLNFFAIESLLLSKSTATILPKLCFLKILKVTNPIAPKPTIPTLSPYLNFESLKAPIAKTNGSKHKYFSYGTSFFTLQIISSKFKKL